MISSLPMYLRPENTAAHQAFWALIRDRLRASGLAAPDQLDTDLSPEAAWGHPDLVLSHICNLPYRRQFIEKVTLIGASDYGLEGCEPGQYRSLFIVRKNHPARTPEDLAGATMAYNSRDSQSGWGAPAKWALDRGLTFRPLHEYGSHRNALRAVVAGQADFATIDAQTFRDLSLYIPETRHVRVVGATDASPGMTFITRGGEDPDIYYDALSKALSALETHHRDRLGLRAIVRLPQTAYDLPIPPEPEEMLAMTLG